jgi:hypothetical protein
VSAGEDPVGEVGVVGVLGPEDEVAVAVAVAVAPGCWSVAVGEHVSAVPGSRRGALLCGVEPLFPSDVQR